MKNSPEKKPLGAVPPLGTAPPLGRFRRWLRRVRPGRAALFILLLAGITSCVRARTPGLRALADAPVYAVLEQSIALPGSERELGVEGYLVRPRTAGPLPTAEAVHSRGPPPGSGPPPSAGPLPAAGPFPCAVILHGRGGWWRAYLGFARTLAGQGFATLIINYQSAHYVDMESLSVPFPYRKRQFELQNEDVRVAAAHFARSSLCAGGRVALIGFSLGADKAFRAAAALPEVRAVVGFYGPYDYKAFIRHRVNRILLALADDDALAWKAYLERTSPLFLAGKVGADVLLFHGAEDRSVPLRQSLSMLRALKKRENGARAALRIYEGAGHNFVLRWARRKEEKDDSLRRTVEFLHRHLPRAGLSSHNTGGRVS